MDLNVILVHLLLAVTMFFVLNWIGKLAQSSGYLTLDIYLQRDEAPAFNFIFRVFGPVIFVMLAACLLYLAGLDQYVQNIWLVIVYHFTFRLGVNLSFGRYLLLNFRREALLWGVSIGLGWMLYEYVIQNKHYLFPEKWLRLFEQLSPIYKWNPGGLMTAQSSPRLWSTRGAPKISFYAAFASWGSKLRYA